MRLRKLYSKWKREISLEYLSEEKFMPFAATDEYFAQPPLSEEYPFMVCGQTVMLSNPDFAVALSSLSETEQEIICLYFFEHQTIIQATNGEPEAVNAVLARYAGYIRYYSHIYGHYNVEMEEIKLAYLIQKIGTEYRRNRRNKGISAIGRDRKPFSFCLSFYG